MLAHNLVGGDTSQLKNMIRVAFLSNQHLTIFYKFEEHTPFERIFLVPVTEQHN